VIAAAAAASLCVQSGDGCFSAGVAQAHRLLDSPSFSLSTPPALSILISAIFFLFHKGHCASQLLICRELCISLIENKRNTGAFSPINVHTFCVPFIFWGFLVAI
jgi:hypothetical protein